MRSSHPLLFGFAALTWTGTELAAEPKTKEAEANGMKLTYVDEGTGEPIVFVHGAVSDLRAWEPIKGEISDRRRFIAPTLRYFGAGDWTDQGERFSPTIHAEDIAAFLKALDVGPVHLVGWSYGGAVTTVAALENPELVQSVILFEPFLASLIRKGEAGNAANEAAGKMFGPVTNALKERDAEKAMKLLIEGVFQMPPGGWDSLPEALRTMQLDNARTMPLLWSAPPLPVTCDMLKRFEKPVLIVYGAESNAFWSQIAEVMDECLPQGKAAPLANVNHDGPVRDPAGFAALIEDFVARR